MISLKNNKGIGLLPLILIIVAIVVIGGVVAGILIIDKNNNKEPITASEFKNEMEELDFEIVDVKNQFAQYDFVEKAYVALEEDSDYQIEFYKLDEEDDAMDFYDNNKKIFQSQKGSTSAETNVNFKNNSKYTLTTNGEYKVVSRIEDTVIYLNVDKEYKDEVKEILKELGY